MNTPIAAAGVVLAFVLAWPASSAAPAPAEDGGGGLLSLAASRCTKSADLLACEEALNIKRNDPELLIGEADALMQLKRPGEAIGVYRNALTVGASPAVVNPKIAAALALRGSLLSDCQTQAGEAAERACESAWLPGAQDEVTVFKRRGALLQAQGKPAAALDAYMAAARLRPRDRNVAHSIVALGSAAARDASTLTALGSAQLTLGHPAEAAASLREALHLSPDLAAAKDRLRIAEHAVAANVQAAPAADPVPTPEAPANFSNAAEVTRSN